jgi:hypothetical protein
MSESIPHRLGEFSRKFTRENLWRAFVDMAEHHPLTQSLLYRTLKAFKYLQSPRAYLQRLVAAQFYDVPENRRGYVSADLCSRVVPPNALPGMEKVVALSRKICSEKKHTRQFEPDNKDYLINIFDDADLVTHKEIIDFAVSDDVLQIIVDYFGTVPRLRDLYYWVTPVNTSLQESQLFHLDRTDTKELKLFILVEDADEGTGPTTYVAANETRRVRMSMFRRMTRIDDDVLKSCLDLTAFQSLIGPAGTAAFVDTSHCFHCGARARTRDRHILVYQFTTFKYPLRDDDFRAGNKENAMAAALQRHAGDELREMVLGGRAT